MGERIFRYINIKLLIYFPKYFLVYIVRSCAFAQKFCLIKNFLIWHGPGKKCCNELALVIKSSKAELQKKRVGTYTNKGLKNGRYYWESTDGRSAIWYYPSYKEWMIGSSFYLGTQFRGISAGFTSVTCPNQNHNRWVFWNGVHWLTDKKQQIHLFCTEDYSEIDHKKLAIGHKHQTQKNIKCK